MITQKGNIHEEPVIILKGVPLDNMEEIKSSIIQEIEKVIKSFSLNNTKQEENLIETIKTNCRKIIKEKTGKKPLTNINLIRI